MGRHSGSGDDDIDILTGVPLAEIFAPFIMHPMNAHRFHAKQFNGSGTRLFGKKCYAGMALLQQVVVRSDQNCNPSFLIHR
ncbi:MAG: hypothetical protein WCI19_10885 [Betaproteobacteria bacterium]